jgi:hypothetical protein
LEGFQKRCQELYFGVPDTFFENLPWPNPPATLAMGAFTHYNTDYGRENNRPSREKPGFCGQLPISPSVRYYPNKVYG